MAAAVTMAIAAAVNAIINALSDYGVADIEMPVTPMKVWRAMSPSKEA